MLFLAFQLLMTPSELPIGAINKAYDAPPFQLAGGAKCGNAEAGFRVIQGKLPNGLAISSRGVFTGVPRENGAFSLRIEGSNGCGRVQCDFTLEIQGSPILETNTRTLAWVWKTGGEQPEAKEFLVAGNWPGLPYRIDGAPKWLEVSMMLGTIPEKHSAFEADMVTVLARPEGLLPGRYAATLTVSAWGSSRSPKVFVELEVQ